MPQSDVTSGFGNAVHNIHLKKKEEKLEHSFSHDHVSIVAGKVVSVWSVGLIIMQEKYIVLANHFKKC